MDCYRNENRPAGERALYQVQKRKRYRQWNAISVIGAAAKNSVFRIPCDCSMSFFCMVQNIC